MPKQAAVWKAVYVQLKCCEGFYTSSADGSTVSILKSAGPTLPGSLVPSPEPRVVPCRGFAATQGRWLLANVKRAGPGGIGGLVDLKDIHRRKRKHCPAGCWNIVSWDHFSVQQGIIRYNYRLV